MKFQNQLDGLQAAFRGFKRINNILEENWSDSNMAAFNGTHLLPISSNGIKCIQETEVHMTSFDNRLSQLSEELRELDYAVNHSWDSIESSLEGCIICHCYVHNRVGDSEMKGFILPREQANYLNDKELLHTIACMKLPEYEDHRDCNAIERISFRPN